MSLPTGSWKILLAGASLFLGTTALVSSPALAHCDGLDGPVAVAARQALDKNDVNRVLIWVHPQDEADIRKTFERTMAVRKLSPQARELADLHFLDTLVRLHRAGEGAAYTGLKPAGRDLGPAIPGADRALETGDVEPLVRLLVDAAEKGLRMRFAAAHTARGFPANDVERGREYVGAYVTFVHYVEGLYATATSHPASHEAPPEEAAPHEH